MVNLNFILARSRSMTQVRLWSDCCFALLFLLAVLFLFITHKSIVSLVVLHLWLPFPLNSFRVQTFWCKCGVLYFSYYAMPGSWWSMGVIALIMSGLFAMDMWNLSSLNMEAPLPWPDTRISGHSLHISFWTKPWHLLFPVAKLVQGAYCKYQSLIPWIFSKTFPAAAYRKTFPAWRWNNPVITCLTAILANFDSNVKNKCFTSKISMSWRKWKILS